MSARRLAISQLALLLLAPVSPAHAEADSAEIPVRAERRLLLGISPAYPMVFGHDVSVPLPAARVGVNLLPVLMVELTAGSLAYETSGRWTLVDVGLRWHVTQGAVSPYVMAHAGDFIDDGNVNEGGHRSYPYLALGGGLEYACRCGFAVWAEAAPALVSYIDTAEPGPRSTEAGLFMSVGLGYRVRTSWQ